MSGALLMISDAYGHHGGVQTYSRRVAEIMMAWGEQRGLPLACASLHDRAESGSVHRHPVRYCRFAGAGGSKSRFAAMSFRLARELRPDVAVVAHLGITPVALALKAAGLLRSYVVMLHGIEAWRRVSAAKRAAARGAAAVVATTRYTADLFAQLNGCPVERMRVVPLGLAELELPPAAPPSAPHDDLRVLTVGRLIAEDHYKGFDMLIDSVGQACREGARIHLTIVGDGNDRPRLEARARALRASGAVSFRGAVSDKRLREEFQRCDVFALPSRYEGFGIVFLEAMRFEKPCIGGNHGGIPEVISHGEDGFLVEHGDVSGLAARLVQFWKQPELRTKMGQRGRSKVNNTYLFPHMRDRWCSLLDGVATERLSCAASQGS